MDNPWNEIELSSYEKHMQSEEVAQLQSLNLITSEQMLYESEYVTILGIAGGNGLEHVNLSKTKKVYAIDINPEYLYECRLRYSHLGDMLQTIQCDLCDKNILLPKCSLLICNLIIEYLGLDTFCDLIRRNMSNIKIVSCVIQKNNGNSFVSNSPTAMALTSLDLIHKDINANDLTECLTKFGMTVIENRKYGLPNNKELVRIDFQIQQQS